jgi:hypothetical protein
MAYVNKEKLDQIYFKVQVLEKLKVSVRNQVQFDGKKCSENCVFNCKLSCSLFTEMLNINLKGRELRCGECRSYFGGTS